jgi:hypothetical protein
MMTLAEQLEQSGILVHTSKGVSMRPLLRENRDLIVVKKKGTERFCKYDVVLFQRQNGEYVLHRIRRVSPDSYWIVGDNCVSGELVRDAQILGVLVEIVRDGKTIRVTDRKYLLFVHFWWAIYPIRGLYKIARMKTAAVYRRIQRMMRSW